MLRLTTVTSLFALMLCTGCGGAATLYVDNDSDDSIRVLVDNDRQLFVSSGGYAKCRVTYGEHHVTVERNGKKIFEETKVFEPGEDVSWRHYLLDPDADTRYAIYEVYYYEDQKTAEKNKRSKRLSSLSKRHWVEVPSGATALSPPPVAFTSSNGNKVKRLCVMAD